MSSALVGEEVAARPIAVKRRASLKQLLLAGAGAMLLLGAIVYAYQYWTVGQYIESTDDAYVGGNVTDLAPQVQATIANIPVTDNQFVHAGDLLVQLDDRDFRAALAKAQAQVAGDRASLANLDATAVLQQDLITQAAANIAAANAQIALAAANQSRYRTLAESNAGSMQDSQTANATYQEALANGEKAHAALAAAQAQLAVIATEKQAQSAALSGALADLTTANLNLGYTEIRAPVDGYIGNRSAQVGAYATIGAQLVSIVPANGLWVDANFKEDQLANMHAGEPVSIVADVLPGQKITGHVGSLAPATGAIFSILPAENATGNFTKIVQRVPVRIYLDGNAATLGLLRPGLSVTASVNTK